MCSKSHHRFLIVFAILLLAVAGSATAAGLEETYFTDGSGFDVHYTFGSWTGTHRLTVDSYDAATGAFSGTGYFVPNPCYSWPVEGTALPDGKSGFKLTYTGSCNTGYYAEHDGSFANTGGKGNCWNNYQKCTWATNEFKVDTGDCDEDGVPDDVDNCVDCDVKGGVVNELGCTMTQLCPCAYFDNHGGYVSCLAHAKNEFVAAGLLTEEAADALQSEAARSDCGKKK